jgi:hypothetical protein
MVQGRIRVVLAQTLVLQNLQMHQLRVAIEVSGRSTHLDG